MFKNPIRVDINPESILPVEHDIVINPNNFIHAKWLLKDVEETTIRVIVVAAVAVTASSALTHIVKTKIK